MHVAVIPPINSLDLAENLDYHMVLAHLVLDKIPEYLQFYRKQLEKGAFVMMDNGVAEGQMLPPEGLAQAAELLCPSEIVLPDALHDKRETLRLVEQALSCPELMSYIHTHNTSLMGVPHGRTLAQWVGCAVGLLQYEEIRTIGISKFEVDLLPEVAVRGRAPFVEILRHAVPNRPFEVHYLGMHGSPVELSLDPQAARGVDTCLPIEAARNGIYLSEDFGLLYRPATWEYSPKTPLPSARYPIAQYNIGVVIKMANKERMRWIASSVD